MTEAPVTATPTIPQTESTDPPIRTGSGPAYIAQALWPLIVPIGSLNPDPRNARKHGEENVADITASLKRFGQRLPVVVQKQGMIVRAGNGRLEVAKRLGWEYLAAVVVDEGDVEATAFALADNRAGELAEWDDGELSRLLQSLPQAERDATGFDDDDLAEVLDRLAPKTVVEDEAPAPLPVPVSRTGDLWVLGEHRLLCGDSTKREDVARVSNGERAAACITDPPYSVNYDESHKTRGGDATVHGAYHEADINPSDLLEFLGPVPTDLLVFSYSVNRHMFVLCDRLHAFGWEVRKELVWVKDTFSFWMGAAYQQRHEPIWICTRNGAGFRGNVDSKVSTVLEYPRPKAHALHPTAKPLELWALLISNHSNPGDALFEPFSGSGTTLIACDQLGRRCHAIEIAPLYIDVAIRRWQKLTGRQATLDGRTWEEVARERGVPIDASGTVAS